jgi:opacity protein-like surface antigen
MRIQAIALFLLATVSAADAQCALGAFPTTNGNGQIVCQSAGGQRPTSSGFDPGGSAIGSCPEGATPGVDGWGNRTCSSLAEQAPARPGEPAPKVKKPKKKQFELSKKCPQCK